MTDPMQLADAIDPRKPNDGWQEGCSTPHCDERATCLDEDGDPRCESCIQGIMEEYGEKE